MRNLKRWQSLCACQHDTRLLCGRVETLMYAEDFRIVWYLYTIFFAILSGSFILTREFPYPSDYGRQAGSGLPSSMVRENMRSEDDDLFFVFFLPPSVHIFFWM